MFDSAHFEMVVEREGTKEIAVENLLKWSKMANVHAHDAKTLAIDDKFPWVGVRSVNHFDRIKSIEVKL